MTNRSYRYGIGKPTNYVAILHFADGSAMVDYVMAWSTKEAFGKLYGKKETVVRVSGFKSEDQFDEQQRDELRVLQGGEYRVQANPVRDWSMLDHYQNGKGRVDRPALSIS